MLVTSELETISRPLNELLLQNPNQHTEASQNVYNPEGGKAPQRCCPRRTMQLGASFMSILTANQSPGRSTAYVKIEQK